MPFSIQPLDALVNQGHFAPLASNFGLDQTPALVSNCFDDARLSGLVENLRNGRKMRARQLTRFKPFLIENTGGDSGIRTPDPRIMIPLL